MDEKIARYEGKIKIRNDYEKWIELNPDERSARKLMFDFLIKEFDLDWVHYGHSKELEVKIEVKLIEG